MPVAIRIERLVGLWTRARHSGRHVDGDDELRTDNAALTPETRACARREEETIAPDCATTGDTIGIGRKHRTSKRLVRDGGGHRVPSDLARNAADVARHAQHVWRQVALMIDRREQVARRRPVCGRKEMPFREQRAGARRGRRRTSLEQQAGQPRMQRAGALDSGHRT